MIHALITSRHWNCLHKLNSCFPAKPSELFLCLKLAGEKSRQDLFYFSLLICSSVGFFWFFFAPVSLVFHSVPSVFLSIPAPNPWEQMMLQHSALSDHHPRARRLTRSETALLPLRRGQLSVSCLMLLSHHWHCKSSSHWTFPKKEWGFIAFVPH